MIDDQPTLLEVRRALHDPKRRGTNTFSRRARSADQPHPWRRQDIGKKLKHVVNALKVQQLTHFSQILVLGIINTVIAPLALLVGDAPPTPPSKHRQQTVKKSRATY